METEGDGSVRHEMRIPIRLLERSSLSVTGSSVNINDDSAA